MSSMNEASAVTAASTSPATSITHRGAVLNGAVTNTSSDFTSVFAIGTRADLSGPVFDYTGPYSSEKTLYIRGGHSTGVGSTRVISFNLNDWTPSGPGSELLPETTYYFRAGIQDRPDDPTCLWDESCYVWGEIRSFTTRAAISPIAVTGDVSLIGADTASVDGSIVTNDASANVYVEYSTTSDLAGATSTSSSALTAGVNEQSISFALAGLSAETTYHYRVVAANRYGTSYGAVKTFTTTPPVGVSINAGANYTTDKEVSLSVSWPVGATSMTISNDGGFRVSTAKNFSLSQSVAWQLDDSIDGLYTKIVYVRFAGPGIDASRTFTDDIIFDNRAPTVMRSKGELAGSYFIVTLSARDQESGLQSIEIKNSSKIVKTDYAKRVLVRASDLGLRSTAAKRGVSKTSTSRVLFRITDKAGNKTSWIAIGSSTTAQRIKPTLTRKISVSSAQVASYLSLESSSRSRLFMRVVPSSRKVCKVAFGRIQAAQQGSCSVVVTGKNKSGRNITITVVFRVNR